MWTNPQLPKYLTLVKHGKVKSTRSAPELSLSLQINKTTGWQGLEVSHGLLGGRKSKTGRRILLDCLEYSL